MTQAPVITDVIVTYCPNYIYLLPPSTQVYMEYMRSLPINDTPEMFGLHDNANITFAVNETYQLLNGVVKLQPKSKSGGGRSQEEVGGCGLFSPEYTQERDDC